MNAGQIINKWIGTGTIRNLEFVSEFKKFRLMLESPCISGPDVLHINLFSINFPAGMTERIEGKYADGDFVYIEGMLTQSEKSVNTKVQAVYIKHFDPVSLAEA